MESGSVTAKKRQKTSFRWRLTTENFLEIVYVSAEKEKSVSYPNCPHRTCWKGTSTLHTIWSTVQCVHRTCWEGASTPTYRLIYSPVHVISWNKKELCWGRGEMSHTLPYSNTWPPVGGCLRVYGRKRSHAGGRKLLEAGTNFFFSLLSLLW